MRWALPGGHATLLPMPETLVPVVARLHDALREMDPARFAADDHHALRERLVDITAALRAHTSEAFGSDTAALADALDSSVPADHAGDADLADLADDPVALWVAARVAIGPSYEALVAKLQHAGYEAKSIRPTNYARTFFHMCSALFALFIMEAFTPQMRYVAAAFLAAATIMETSRRVSPAANERLMAAFGKVAHPYEHHRVNSASWYAAALVLIAFVTPVPSCAAAVVVLGFADPAAGFVGRKYGRTTLLHGRTLEGSVTFALVGGLAALLVLRLFHADVIGWTAAATIAAVSGLSGSLAELLSKRVDDNFSIPVAVAFATMWIPWG